MKYYYLLKFHFFRFLYENGIEQAFSPMIGAKFKFGKYL